MHKSNFYIWFGIWLIILPFLGVPILWRNTLVFLSGLFLVMIYLWPNILKKLQAKPKTKKKTARIVETVKSNEQDKELKFSENNIKTPTLVQTETEI